MRLFSKHLGVRLAVFASLFLAACQPEPTAVSPSQPQQAAQPAAPTAAPAQPAAPQQPAAEQPAPPASADGIPAPFADPAKKPRVALVREIGEGSFFERYLAGAQSMARELGIELLESNAGSD